MHTRLLFTLVLAGTCGLLAQAPHYIISTAAGSYPLGDNGPATSALLLNPQSVAVDGLGNLLVAEPGVGLIRKVESGGRITTLVAMAANHLAPGPEGSVLAASSSQIVRINTAGEISAVAGSGRSEHTGDGGPATAAGIRSIGGLTYARDGSIYFSDPVTHVVRRVSSNGTITTIAGIPNSSGASGDDGPADQARLNRPQGLAVIADGSLFISDAGNRRIRKVSTSGVMTTAAGTSQGGFPNFSVPANRSPLRSPGGMIADNIGGVLFTDFGAVLRLSADGFLRLAAGSATGVLGNAGDGGLAADALFASPVALGFDVLGNLYVADAANDRVRRVAPSGIISTYAGRSHFAGDEGPAASALLHTPESVALDPAGNLFISDTLNHRIRRVAANGTISTIAGTGVSGFSGDGGAALGAQLNSPGAIAVDGDGRVVFFDKSNSRVRVIERSGTIRTVAGNGVYGSAANGAQAVASNLGTIRGIAVDVRGMIYLADNNFNRVWRVEPNGLIRVHAGTGGPSFGGDGGPATAAQIRTPSGMVFDAEGNLWIGDSGNARVRRVSADGVISTIAGTGVSNWPQEGGIAAENPLGGIQGVALDGLGNLFICHWSAIHRVGRDGRIHKIGGGGPVRRVDSDLGDGGSANDANLGGNPWIVASREGDLWIADPGIHRIRKMTLNTPTRMEVAGGNDQRGPVGRPVAEPLRIRVTGRAGAGVAGLPVTFSVIRGEAQLNPSTLNTDSTGIARVQVTLGNLLGPVTVSATAAGLPAVTFELTAEPYTGPPPITDIVSAGMSTPPVRKLAVGGLAVLLGGPFAESARQITPDDYVEGKLPTNVAGLCVRFGPELAPILSVAPNQVRVQVPAVAPGEVGVRTVVNCGGETEAAGPEFPVTVALSSPEFFTSSRLESGKAVVSATRRDSGTAITVAEPARPGDVIVISGTGFGPKNPGVVPGEVPAGQAAVAATKIRVELGNLGMADEDVLYVGAQAGSPGIDQLVIRLRSDIAEGDLPILLILDDSATPEGTVLPVRR